MIIGQNDCERVTAGEGDNKFKAVTEESLPEKATNTSNSTSVLQSHMVFFLISKLINNSILIMMKVLQSSFKLQ